MCGVLSSCWYQCDVSESIIRTLAARFLHHLHRSAGKIGVNRILFTAVLPKRLYKTHTSCIHYHLRDNTHRLLLWPYTSPCPLSTSWHLFRMVCFSLFPPHPTSRACILHPEEAARYNFCITYIGARARLM